MVTERTVDGEQKWCVVHASPQKPDSPTDKPPGSIIKCFPHTSEGKAKADAMHRAILASTAKSLLRSWEPKATSAIISGEASHYLFPQKYKRDFDEPVFIGDEDANEALAVVKLGEPSAVHIGDVERDIEKLGVTLEEVSKRWPSMRRFWLYPVELIETFESGREFAASTVKGSWVDGPVFRQKAEDEPVEKTEPEPDPVSGSESVSESEQPVESGDEPESESATAQEPEAEPETSVEKTDDFGVSWDAQIVKRVDAKRLVTAIVLKPETTDAQGTIMSADVIENAAHDFVVRLIAGKAKGIGYMHKIFGKDLFLVESFIAPDVMSIGGQIVPKGAWVMKVKVVDDEIWAKVLAGEIRGFSIGGKARVTRTL